MTSSDTHWTNFRLTWGTSFSFFFSCVFLYSDLNVGRFSVLGGTCSIGLDKRSKVQCQSFVTEVYKNTSYTHTIFVFTQNEQFPTNYEDVHESNKKYRQAPDKFLSEYLIPYSAPSFNKVLGLSFLFLYSFFIRFVNFENQLLHKTNLLCRGISSSTPSLLVLWSQQTS